MIWLLLFLALSPAIARAQVRPAAVAGSFYPADPAALAKMVDDFIARATPPPIDGTVQTVVSPHAGYEFSGAVAAHGYALVKGKHYDRVVVIAPSHVDGFSFVSVYNGDAYQTPLGTVPVDKAFCKKIVNGDVIQLSTRGHVIPGERGEHALEDELPFLQRAIGDFKLVPIIMGDQSYEASRALGLALAREIKGSNTLIVASSDLSHYHPYDDAVKLDHKTLRAIQDWDYLSMSENFQRRVWEACGGAPIVAAMIASERLGAAQPHLLKYANSGDVTGDKTHVVGYSSWVFVKPSKPRAEAAPAFTLSDAEKDGLLKLARQSVETAVKDRKLYQNVPLAFESFNRELGAFVTLKEHGELRGCIGSISPVLPLAETVRDVAAEAAVQDSRFAPVSIAELGQLEYEISVLSPLRRVLDVTRIQVGRDGLIMKRGDKLGLLLPQVPVEQHWDRKTFLEEACHKAGLPTNAWQQPDTDIFSFTALVFGEHKSAPPAPEPERSSK
ncbi:MAG TPA: AmmeMemoRadiSam system protein B [Bryobacteraceae bacterium]|nr:AmmeMemoRadiSam system protein B [Bryobacteraceae bacterium]